MLPTVNAHRAAPPGPAGQLVAVSRRTTSSQASRWQPLWLLPLACCALVAMAQPAPRRGGPAINGTVTSLQGQTLQVDTRANGQVTLTLGAQARIIDQEPASLSDVKAGRFIGTTAVQEADGKLHAREIHIFPESMRGAGEGHYPMGQPNTTMTNGNVEAVNGSVTQSASSSGALRLRISYKGGQSVVEVPSNVSVTMMQAGDRSLLRPGANVTVLAQPSATGLVAGAIIVHGRAGG
jgi:hypothetical protein